MLALSLHNPPSMNIPFAVFQSDGTSFGSNGLLKHFLLDQFYHVTILVQFLDEDYLVVLTWCYLIDFQIRLIHFYFRSLFPVIILLPYFVTMFSWKIGRNSLRFWNLPREASWVFWKMHVSTHILCFCRIIAA